VSRPGEPFGGDDNDGIEPVTLPVAQEEADLNTPARALTRLARLSLGQMTPAQRVRGIEGVQARQVRGRRRAVVGLAFAGVASVAAGVALIPRVLRHGEDAPAPLSYRVENGALTSEGVIHAREDAEPAFKFIDGTVIKLAPGSKGRLSGVDSQGARVSIESGSAHVNVVPKPRARWMIDAGPFHIAVHGTVFTAAWDENEGRLDVQLERGLVSVTGPVTSGPIPVRTGQHLTVTLRQPRVLLRDLDDVEETPALAPATARPNTSPVASVASRPARPVRGVSRSWAAALSAGDFDEILAEAEHDLGRALAHRNTDDLAALADAARYRRHDDVARRALGAQRRRFPNSPRAADAAFFLGRLDENGGSLGRALGWYDRYLSESPSGSYAAEALGRKMMAVRETSGPDAARAVADEYIRRFPRGSYAGAAEALRRDR
jgi:hypothetical protein